MDYSRKLAEFCASVSLDALPSEVVHKAKLCILDYVANIYGSLELEAVDQVVKYIKSLNTPGPATVLGCGFSTDIHHAAFINGTTAEAIEAQDGLRFGGNHPGTAVIPAALAVAESLKLGGGSSWRLWWPGTKRPTGRPRPCTPGIRSRDSCPRAPAGHSARPQQRRGLKDFQPSK
jgi:2-methylcitrate dehydratase PrpD